MAKSCVLCGDHAALEFNGEMLCPECYGRALQRGEEDDLIPEAKGVLECYQNVSVIPVTDRSGRVVAVEIMGLGFFQRVPVTDKTRDRLCKKRRSQSA